MENQKPATNNWEALNWTKYALAGTALLASPIASEAAVIVSGPLNINLSVTANSDFVNFDFDGDSNVDLTVAALDGTSGPDILRFVIAGGGSGQIVGSAFFATALGGGQIIGPGSSFDTKGYLLKDKTSSTIPVPAALQGNWPNDLAQFRYLGFSFDGGDLATHYGWLRVSAQLGSADATITDWAYEDVADVPIATPDDPVPEPSSMALFALGATGVAALKRRRKKANQ